MRLVIIKELTNLTFVTQNLGTFYSFFSCFGMIHQIWQYGSSNKSVLGYAVISY